MTVRIGSRALISLLAVVQTAAYGETYRPPRLSGHPDLQGAWTSTSLTPLERPAGFASLIATDEEVAKLTADRKRHSEKAASDAGAAPTAALPVTSGDVGQEQTEFGDRNESLMRIDGRYRSSVIVDPPDGLLPYTATGLSHAAAAQVERFDNPEERPLSERCIEAPNGMDGPPMLSGPDNANLTIVQTPGDLAIELEQIHDVRIVHMGAAHPSIALHPWMGDSIGHWEGQTLVIETVDQNPHSAPRAVGPRVFWLSGSAKVTERLTRVGRDAILYRFEVDDPADYRSRWTGEMMLRRSTGRIFEYACHEGNYALRNILSGARRGAGEAKR